MLSSLVYNLKFDQIKHAPKQFDEMFERDTVHWRVESKFVVAYGLLKYIMVSYSITVHKYCISHVQC